MEIVRTKNIKGIGIQSILEELPAHDYQGRRYKLLCNCGVIYNDYKRNVKRSKVTCCPDCRIIVRRYEMALAREKKKKWVAPLFRTCKSCSLVKNYKECFQHGRHTCKKCSNIGRMAYYDNNFKHIGE